MIFSRCSLREATFTGTDLGGGLFADCDLRLTEFGAGGYRDLDLRGNDLSQVRGVGALQRVIVDRSQTLQLAEALAAELELTYGEDPDSA
ncbi:pentapeptide repeat-containing protein [Streptomyces jumonjinensis]|uniref:pentapeptide repeat-containing protein n=1 Tax=Streptomyces jumonjinensis TaxID=1945 RepID=UPI00188677BF|nr:pentapeptide repeat-containing protein [Streptomyces jumonjinensis]